MLDPLSRDRQPVLSLQGGGKRLLSDAKEHEDHSPPDVGRQSLPGFSTCSGEYRKRWRAYLKRRGGR